MDGRVKPGHDEVSVFGSEKRTLWGNRRTGYGVWILPIFTTSKFEPVT